MMVAALAAMAVGAILGAVAFYRGGGSDEGSSKYGKKL